MDAVFLARLQFAATAFYHYLFVPLSVGFGLILAILLTKAYRTGDAHDEALATFWTRLFAGTFAVGVATGITMEFSFGTNWAEYSRFVGDIFGAPLAAEALFAFFMESVFLGILLFGKNRIGRKAYLASGWLVWFGSCLSCLWIIIANSWMQTPAGYEVVQTAAGSKAILTSFFAAAFNPSTMQRFCHVVIALLITGALCAMAVAAYYMLKEREADFSNKLMKVGVIVALVSCILMMPAAHQQAVEVSEQQPAKLAAMEGQWETGPIEMSLFGWVDETTQTTTTIGIPGLTSWLASGSFDTEYPGLNDFDADYYPGNINAIFQCYHLMLYMLGIIAVALILGILVMLGKVKSKLALRIIMIGWIAALLAIEFGWMVAELGRQPWIVYGELLTADANSLAVTPTMLIITLVLFAVIYIAIYALWLRTSFRIVKKGPSSYMPEEWIEEEPETREEGVRKEASEQ